MSMEEIVKGIESAIKNGEYKLVCDLQQEPIIRTHHVAYNPVAGKCATFDCNIHNCKMIKVYTATCERAFELMNDLECRFNNLGIEHDTDEKFMEIWMKDYIISFENIFGTYSRYNSNIMYYVDMTACPRLGNTYLKLENAKMHHRPWTKKIEFDDIVEVIKNVKK